MPELVQTKDVTRVRASDSVRTSLYLGAALTHQLTADLDVFEMPRATEARWPGGGARFRGTAAALPVTSAARLSCRVQGLLAVAVAQVGPEQLVEPEALVPDDTRIKLDRRGQRPCESRSGGSVGRDVKPDD